MKLCKKCGEHKSLPSFSKDKTKRDGYSTVCRVCRKKYRDKRFFDITKEDKICTHCGVKKHWAQFSKNKRNATGLYSWCKVCDRDKTRRIKYGDDYKLHASKTNCDICKIAFDEQNKFSSQHIDHCHSTGVVRGALCHRCNIALGYFSDDIELLLECIRYLKKHEKIPSNACKYYVKNGIKFATKEQYEETTRRTENKLKEARKILEKT